MDRDNSTKTEEDEHAAMQSAIQVFYQVNVLSCLEDLNTLSTN